jgi:uncharacterized phage-associated protein
MDKKKEFPFDEQKATQAATFFVKKSGGKINYMRLMKLLYLADRESFQRRSFPICGGEYSSMDNGPFISSIFEVMRPTEDYSVLSSKFPTWPRCLCYEGYDICVMSDPGAKDLSKADIAVMDSVYQEFGQKDQWDLVCYTQKNCPEWIDPQGTIIPISQEEILLRIGKSKSWIDVVLR